MGRLIGHLLFSFLGYFLLYNGLPQLRLLRKLKKEGRRTEGFVIRQVKGEPFLTTVPLIRFTDTLGNQVESVPKNAIPMRPMSFHSPGDKLTIYHDINDPTNFVIDTFANKIGWSILILTGSLFLLAVFYSIIFTHSQ